MGKYKKLSARYCGPFVITKKINQQDYKLLLPPHIKVHNVFHINLLKEYVLDANHILDDGLPLVSKDGILDITLERILQSREHSLQIRSINEYLIKWTTYLEEDATWEREDSLVQTYPNFMSR